MWQPIAWQLPPIFKTIPKQLHVTDGLHEGGQLLLIIPNASLAKLEVDIF
jgi:hypothetical protein